MSPLYEFSVPVFIKSLGGLKIILEKAQTHGLDDVTLLAASLAPDMFPLVRQVQIACDNAKGIVARLSGQEIPVYPDTETTIGALIARIDTTITYLQSVPPEMFASAAERPITLAYFPGMYMTGFEYLRSYALGNFFFHVTTTYDIIRHLGVMIGKADYTNGMPLKPLA